MRSLERLTEDQCKILILFGCPGAGKETVARVLTDLYKCYFFYNGDDDNTPEMKQNLQQNRLHTIEQRDQHVELMIVRIHELSEKHSWIALKQALPMERHRLMLHKAIPDATFLYVEAPPFLVQVRVAERARARGHHVSSDYAAKMSQIYEEPQLPHIRIINDISGVGKIKAQLYQILPPLNQS